MSLADWLAIGGIAISALVAYHIAIRQNVFARVRVALALFNPTLPQWPWAIIVGVPDRGADYYAFDVPVFIQNGAQPARNLWLQISHESGRHCSEYEHAFSDTMWPPEDDIRVVHHLKTTEVEYTREVMRAEEVCAFADAVVFHAHQLVPNSGSRSPASIVRLTCRFENHPQIQRSYWVVAVRSESMSELMKHLSDITEVLFARENIKVRYAWAGRPTFMRPGSRRLVHVSQLGFQRIDGRTAIDVTTDYTRHTVTADVFPLKGVGLSVTRPRE